MTAGQPDLSTKAAQHQHYRAIHARVVMAKPKPHLAITHCEIEPPVEECVALEREPESVVVKHERKSGPLTVRRIQRVVAKYFGLHPSDILSKSRKLGIAHGRHIAMYLSRRILARSYAEIGGFFGGIDHSSCLHAHRKIERLRQVDPELASDLAAIESRLALTQ